MDDEMVDAEVRINLDNIEINLTWLRQAEKCGDLTEFGNGRLDAYQHVMLKAEEL